MGCAIKNPMLSPQRTHAVCPYGWHGRLTNQASCRDMLRMSVNANTAWDSWKTKLYGRNIFHPNPTDDFWGKKCFALQP